MKHRVLSVSKGLATAVVCGIRVPKTIIEVLPVEAVEMWNLTTCPDCLAWWTPNNDQGDETSVDINPFEPDDGTYPPERCE